MQLKRFVAGAMGFLMAGSTMAFAAGLDDLPQPFAEDGNVADNALVVVGSDAKPSDIVGGINIAARLGSESTDAVSAGGSSGTYSVSGDGAALKTSNQDLYFGDSVNKARTTLTKSDIDLLAGGTVNVDGTDYDYSEYVEVGSTNTVISTSGGDLDDAQLIMDVGTDASSPLYTNKVTFDKAINVTKAAEDSETITILGKDYTFTDPSQTDETKVNLFGSSNSELLSVGDTVTVTVGGSDYDIEMNGISDSSTAVISVDGTTKEVTDTGSTSYTINGLDLNVQGVYSYGEGEGQIQLAMGSNKIVLANDSKVKIADEKVDGTNAVLTASGTDKVSEIKINVAAGDNDYDHLASGESFSDPVFGGLNVEFAGSNPAVKSDSRSQIEVTTDGDQIARLALTNPNGDDAQFDITKDPDLSSTGSMDLGSGDYSYKLVEGADLVEDDYFFINQGGFEHLLTVSDIEGSEDEDEITFDDVFSGNSYTATLSGGSDEVYIDGQKYFVNSDDSSTVQVTWDSGASAGDTGDEVTVSAPLEDENGAMVALVNNDTEISGLDSGDKINLPTGSSAVSDSDLANITFNDTTSNNSILKVGQVQYKFEETADDGSTGSTLAVSLTDQSGSKLSKPAVIVEEEEADSSNKDALILSAQDVSNGNEIYVDSPILTGNSDDGTLDNDDKIYMDEYGTYVEYDNDDKQSLTAYYPDSQATMEAFVLTEGASVSESEGTSASTINEAVALTTPLGKLDSDVTSANKDNKNLILVGGPAVNSLVADLASANKTEARSWYVDQGAGTALIDYVDDAFGTGKAALVVAGHSASDTTKAAEVVQQYDSYSDELSGSEAVLKVSDGSVSFQ